MIDQDEPQEFKIEKDVPLPHNFKRPKPKGPKYPFRDMEPGDSLFIPGEKTGGAAHDRMKKHGRHPEKQFIARNVEGGFRCWRVS